MNKPNILFVLSDDQGEWVRSWNTILDGIKEHDTWTYYPEIANLPSSHRYNIATNYSMKD